jgi:hypothetical protein
LKDVILSDTATKPRQVRPLTIVKSRPLPAMPWRTLIWLFSQVLLLEQSEECQWKELSTTGKHLMCEHILYIENPTAASTTSSTKTNKNKKVAEPAVKRED